MDADAIDQSWGFVPPDVAKAKGIRVVSMYLSHDASKNATPAKVKAYHAAGVAVLLNWESHNGAPLLGALQGTADATEAVRQAKALFAAVGYGPKNHRAIYFSCDIDTQPAQWPTIAEYYTAAKAVCKAAGFRVGVYGEADLVDYLAKNGITQAEWQTYAWSGGRVSTYADFYQFQNGMKMGGADVDFDKVLHEQSLYAWWPPGHRLDVAPPKPVVNVPVEVKPVPNRNLTDADVQAIVDGVWGHPIAHATPDGKVFKESAARRLLDALLYAKTAAGKK